MTWQTWARNIAWAASAFVNAMLFGRPGESLSTRIGWNIAQGGLWSRIPLPGWLRRHFEQATQWSDL